MAILTLVASLCLAPTNAALFDESLAAHQKLAKSSVAIAVDSRLAERTVKSRFELVYARPAAFKLVVRETVGIPTHRTYALSGSKFVGYDHDTNEIVRREAAVGKNLAERAVVVLGSLEDAVQVVLDSGVMGSLYGRFRGLDWARTQTHDLVKLKRASKLGSSMFAFDRTTHLLREFRIVSRDGSAQWTIHYAKPPAQIAFSMPVDAKPVQAFSLPKPPPTYATQAARQVAESCARAYDHLRWAEFEMTTGNATSHIWLGSGVIRVRGTAWEWGADGRKAWAAQRLGKGSCQGSCTLGKAASSLEAIGCATDTHLVQLLRRRNPVRQMLVPGGKGRLIGRIVLDGAPCDILEVSLPSVRISLAVRRADRLLAQIVSDNLDGSGRRIAGSERRFRYLSVGKPVNTGASAPKLASGRVWQRLKVR